MQPEGLGFHLISTTYQLLSVGSPDLSVPQFPHL